MATTTSPGLGGRTLRGMAWAYGSFLGLRLTTVITTAILARLLTPKDFGVVAVAVTFMGFLEMVQGLGVSQAIVIAPEEQLADQADTGFTVSVALGAALALVAAALGPAAASFFHEPRLTAVMPVLGTTFFILSLSSTHYALAMRNIDFRSRTIAELADAGVRGIVGIALALAGAGVWSLILGYVAGNLALTGLLWWLVPWRPRHLVSLKHVRKLLSFGGYVTGIGVMAAFLAQFDNLVVGRVLGARELGFYSIATRIPALFILNVAVVAGQVLFPAFSALDGDDLRRGVITCFRYIATAVFPLTVFLIVLAEPITITIFGPRWHGAVGAAQVLCLWAVMSPISMVCGNAFMSRGRARLMFMLAIPQAIALVIGSLLFAPHGIVAVSWVQATIAIVAQIVTLAIARQMLDLNLTSLLGAFVPPLLASAALAAVLLGIDQLVSASIPTIAIGAIAGGLVYLAVLHLFARDLLPGIYRMVFARGATGESR
jgi:O-antigen/teichoic acid export membrane protein